MSATKLCRLCAHPKLYFIDVTSSSSDGTAIMDLIKNYLSIKVEIVDGYPAVVCCECNNQLTTFHQFTCQVRDAQAQLQQMSANVKYEDRYIGSDIKFSANLDGEIFLKQEWIKEEIDEDDGCAENADTSSGYNVMIIEPQMHPKLPKKRGRKPKKIREKKSKNSCAADDIMLQLRNELKSEEIPLAEYKRGKRTKKKHENHFIFQKIIKMEDPIICYICNESFTNLLELRKHQQSHLTKNTTHPWPCVKCDKKFKNRQAAMRHIRVKHEGVLEFICHECGRTFSTKGNLEDHLTTHSDVTNFECDKCGKKFKLKQALMRHLDTHRGTVYQCPKCAILLNSRRTLRNHMFTHDEVGRQECHICGKRFKLRKTLKLHFHIHTGERPFQCLWCDKTFTNNSNCRIHKKRVHKFELMKYEAERDAKGKISSVSGTCYYESRNKHPSSPKQMSTSQFDIQKLFSKKLLNPSSTKLL